MPRFKNYSYDQTTMVAISFDRQIRPGSFEFALGYIVDKELDLSVFDSRFNNDSTGAPAYDPALLLKIVLYAYSRGIHSSRDIEAACRENVMFMALSAETRPHFTTIAHFISSMKDQIVPLFRDVLTLCYAEGLISRDMFAIDGCKISSNCSKEWSGTKAQLDKKRQKIEKSINFLVGKHKQSDDLQRETDQFLKEKKAIENLQQKADKIKKWLSCNTDKKGARERTLQSNITDNESVKRLYNSGVVQGYTGSAAVDAKHQVIVHAEAFGLNQEKAVLQPMIEGIRENFEETNIDKDVLQSTTIVADTGYHSEENLKMLEENAIQAYIADTRFRKRDKRFRSAPAHRKSAERNKAKYFHKRFHAADFILNKNDNTLACPAGRTLRCVNPAFKNTSGLIGPQYQAEQKNCNACAYKNKCLQGSKKHPRSVALFTHRDPNVEKSYTHKMIEKFDTDTGRFMYSRRMGIVEPVFGNMRNTMKFSWFSLRGKAKVDVQWKLMSIVHNIGKVFAFSERFSLAAA